MKIVHITTDDSDGAGRAAARLHAALRHAGAESQMLVSKKGSTDPMVQVFKLNPNWRSDLEARRYKWSALRRQMRYQATRPAGYERFSLVDAPHLKQLLARLPKADLYHLHSIEEFIDYPGFFSQVSPHAPIVWTLHDMYPFTGGCHYDHGCGRFKEQCGSCPQLGSMRPEDLSRQVWAQKRKIFAKIPSQRLQLVALNPWMAEQIRQSSLLARFPVTIIPNSLDLQPFAPRDKAFSRSVLGIPGEARVVLFVAGSITNRRKGYGLLLEALKELKDIEGLFLLSMGQGCPETELPIASLHLGVVQNDRLISLVYSSADVFVCPSLQDNLPNTLLEAMACGVPSAGFNVGGIPALIQPGATGALAPAGDSQALSQAIRLILMDESNRARLSAACRETAVNIFSPQIQAQRMLALYKDILSG